MAQLVASLPPHKQEVLARLGLAELAPPEYLSRAGELLSSQLAVLRNSNPEQYQIVVASILEGLLTPDGKSFASAYLREAYDSYKANPRTRQALDPISWIHRSQAEHVALYLTSVIGRDYRVVVREATRVAAGKSRVIATEENIAQVFSFYDKAFKLGLVPYKDLDNLRKSKDFDAIRALLQDCFQFEHPVELRFVRNLDGRQHFKVVEDNGRVRWALDMKPLEHDVENEFLALVVPRTQRHAVLMHGGGPLPENSALHYSQHPKTGEVASRIPHGTEHLFTPQEIADVTCATLFKAKFDRLATNPAQAAELMGLLQVDFNRMTRMINDVRQVNKVRFKTQF
jgi:hypothetical protein